MRKELLLVNEFIANKVFFFHISKLFCNDFNKTLFLYLFLLFNQQEIENLASGSVQQNLSKDLIVNLELIVPPIEIIENLPFKEIYDKIINNYFPKKYLIKIGFSKVATRTCQIYIFKIN